MYILHEKRINCTRSALFVLQSIPFHHVRERIRTPDTLVRSQVLYPAELHVQRKYYNTRIFCKSQGFFSFIRSGFYRACFSRFHLVNQSFRYASGEQWRFFLNKRLKLLILRNPQEKAMSLMLSSPFVKR